jgi:UBX domain-containing protein 1/4
VAKKKAEQQVEKEHKRAVLAKIQEDKERRRQLAEKGSVAAAPAAVAAPVQPAAQPQAAKPAVNHSQARLRLQWQGGQTTKTLDAETTLFEVAQALESEFGFKPTKFESTYPRKVFTGDVDWSKSLKEAGLVPSAVLRAA